ncbi:uncharacterized protein LOC101218071 isoform X1 [Cucumis sativus]|uniref:Replication factor C C-terminal domain-containing protein n=1 Tax=Cucumis sativus TaxID=3659 RepID=A0A0A0KJ59_CUCSA|nr:uncharacterized protein LOC101218071 isoform X1 [Cucumis sativus]XP_031742421.1 uncharacterized protein LOC101218071 isoform X1 [Cucumis sativus]KGN48844.1 hypothetical protein Csa_004326 [Cucumis sativus]
MSPALNLMKQRKDGYEPSDTETEWQESPWNDPKEKKLVLDYNNRRTDSAVPKKFSMAANVSPPGLRRNGGKTPRRPAKDDSVLVMLQRNISPLSRAERRRHESPFKASGEEIGSSSMRSRKEEKFTYSHGSNKTSQKPSYSRRSVTAPRLRMKDEHMIAANDLSQRRERAAPTLKVSSILQQPKEVSHAKSPSIGEMNELIADGRINRGLALNDPVVESTGSISPGDIFFSRDGLPVGMNNNVTAKRNAFKNYISPKPTFVTKKNDDTYNQVEVNANGRGVSSTGGGLSTTTNSSAAVSRENSSRISLENSKISDVSGRTSESTRRFIANRRKKKNDIWFSCMRNGTCRTTKSPEKRPFDEATYIEKANVVEYLKPFWADQHRPVSLNGFTFHKHEAQLLKQLVSQDSFPHILFKGPRGSGKRVLMMALLREIYGDSCWNVSHDLRRFQIQERKLTQVFVPLTSSAHHVELNLSSESNAKYALLGLAKEIGSEYSINVEARNVNPKAIFKVVVLLDVDKATEDIQHLLRWIMDGYKDACKVVLCCEDDSGILESVISRCKVIKINPPVTHEIMDVLIKIAEKEEFDLPMNFASKIATKAKQNLRKAIMALEACKAHNYPFSDDQPIPIGWEDALVELASHILEDPSNPRLHQVKEKIQKLLVDSVHPKLILQKLVEQFLKRIEMRSRRELYYWHAYYNKRLPIETGVGALPKLEEFVAKFMSMYRKSSNNFVYD